MLILHLLIESLQIRGGPYILFSSFCHKSHLEKQTESYANQVLVPVLFNLSHPLVICTTLLYMTYSWLHYLSYQNYFKNFYNTFFFSCCLYCIYRENSASFPPLTCASLVLFSPSVFLSKMTYICRLPVTYYFISQND